MTVVPSRAKVSGSVVTGAGSRCGGGGGLLRAAVCCGSAAVQSSTLSMWLRTALMLLISPHEYKKGGKGGSLSVCITAHEANYASDRLVKGH